MKLRVKVGKSVSVTLPGFGRQSVLSYLLIIQVWLIPVPHLLGVLTVSTMPNKASLTTIINSDTKFITWVIFI